MALNKKVTAPKPTGIQVVMDDVGLHYHTRPGGGGWWTLNSALALTLLELTVHWSEENTPPGKDKGYYYNRILKIADYHANVRDWDAGTKGVQKGNHLMYHWMIDPEGGLWQTSPESLRTWNAMEANSYNISVCLMAGHSDQVTDKAKATLVRYLNWMTMGRADLPLITPVPRVLALPSIARIGFTTYSTHGVLSHDESLARNNHKAKGCCGIYEPLVNEWRKQAAYL